MVLSLSLESEQIAEIAKYYQDIDDRTRDLQPIARELGEIQREELVLRFLSAPATQTGGVVHGDVYWNRLSDWYLNQVPRRKEGQIMIDSQKLKTDATTPGAGNTSRFENGQYSFSINTYYAQKQDKVRSLLFWSDGLLRKTEEAIVGYILTGDSF